MHISEMQEKIHEKCYFWDNGVWTCFAKLCTSQREYLLWAVNMLTNSVKISDQTNADFFQLNLSQMHGKIG